MWALTPYSLLFEKGILPTRYLPMTWYLIMRQSLRNNERRRLFQGPLHCSVMNPMTNRCNQLIHSGTHLSWILPHSLKRKSWIFVFNDYKLQNMWNRTEEFMNIVEKAVPLVQEQFRFQIYVRRVHNVWRIQNGLKTMVEYGINVVNRVSGKQELYSRTQGPSLGLIPRQFPCPTLNYSTLINGNYFNLHPQLHHGMMKVLRIKMRWNSLFDTFQQEHQV